MAALGIDFGSSFCTVSWLNQGKAEVAKFNGDGSVKVPTLILGTDNHLEFGFLVASILEEVSKMPYENRMEAISNFVPNLKRKLSKRGMEYLAGKKYSHKELLECFLEYLIDEALKDCGSDYDVDTIVISHPVNWNLEPTKINLLRDALSEIGYPNVETCEEPISAVKGYSINHYIQPNDAILVFDYGGGTTDVALVQKIGDNLKVVLPSKGNQYCGGQDIDVLLYEQLRKEILQNKKFDISAREVDTILLRNCQRLKEKFSGNNDYYETTLLLNLNGRLETYRYGLNRETFNNIIYGKVSEAVNVAKQVIEEANKRHIHINKVLMIGGSSNITLVKDLLLELVEDAEIITSGEKDVSVALGNIAQECYSDEFEEDYTEETSYDNEFDSSVNVSRLTVVPPENANNELLFNF